jgi:hypothetical protein
LIPGDLSSGRAGLGATGPLIYGDFATGRVGLGTTSPTEKLDVNGTARFRTIATGAGTKVQVDANGKLCQESSSRRYKTDIATLAEEGDKVPNLWPVRFRWQTTGEPDIGLIAEEVAGVLDSLVIRDAEGKPEAVKYDKVALYLLSVIKAQQQRIETQQHRIKALELAETENELIERRIAALEQSLRQIQFPETPVR